MNARLITPDFSVADAAAIATIGAQVDEFLARIQTAIDALVTIEEPTWDSLQDFNAANDAFDLFWSPISHINSVQSSDALRDVYNAQLPKISELYTTMGQNKALFSLYKTIHFNESANLDAEQNAVLAQAIRDFKLSGVNLDDKKKQQYQTLASELSQLISQFSNNVMDATQAWQKHITDIDELKGLPQSAVDLAQQMAQNKDLDGYLLTLDYPSFGPILKYADNQDLRAEVYKAFSTRASELDCDGQYNNAELMEKILACRSQMANLLGFDNYVAYSLANKMAKDETEVLDFLNELADASKQKAEQEYQEVYDFAQKTGDLAKVYAWDISYYSEKLKQAHYAITEEETRIYFPLPTVLQGLFSITGTLFNIEITVDETVPSYHEDVKFYRIFRDGELIAGFFLDPFARDKKRGGAWMNDFTGREQKAEELQLPVAYLVCNFSPAIGDKDALLTHNEVQTLFHEFGHGLHHMLTQVSRAGVAGISGVEWDAVELPSQLLENWCWQEEGLALMSAHAETGEPLPKALLDKLLAAKNFQSAMAMVRQLEFSLFDIKIHAENDLSVAGIYDILAEVRKAVAVVPAPSFNRFAHAFSHIFAGGYAAGYYSYKWAEVLSADFFTEFSKHGILDRKTGQRYLDCFLAQGGVVSADKMCERFLGRAPSGDALLKQEGIV